MSSLIQIWTATLDREPAQLAQFHALLDAEEKARADRFLREQARTRFTVSRGLLRIVLGQLLERDPASFAFTYGYNGKPELAEKTGLQFNVSHSGRRWYLAVAEGRRLGVDVERVRPDFATFEIANRFFAPREVADLTTFPAEERANAFFRCWTRKEAFIKAIGAGLGFPLQEFVVSLGESAELRSISGSIDAALEWSMEALIAPEGYCAALAVEGPVSEVQYAILE